MNNTNRPVPLVIEGLGRNAVKRYQALETNRSTFDKWVYTFANAALNSFTWEGLPDSVDPRYLEYALLMSGSTSMADFSGSMSATNMVAFFDVAPPTQLFVVMPATVTGTPDIYMNPKTVMCTAPNGTGPYVRDVSRYGTRDGAIGFDNTLRRSLWPLIEDYAFRIAEIDRVIDVNVSAQSTPWMMTVPEGQVKDATNLYKMVASHEPVIMRNPAGADLVKIDVLNLNAPYVVDKLLADQAILVHQMLTLLGINNANIAKKERMIVSEAESNDEEILAMRTSRLAAREQFASDINTVFGLDVGVSYAGESASTFDGGHHDEF